MFQDRVEGLVGDAHRATAQLVEGRPGWPVHGGRTDPHVPAASGSRSRRNWHTGQLARRLHPGIARGAFGR
jgi:hypothetical protein